MPSRVDTPSPAEPRTPPLGAVFLDRDGTLIKHKPYLRDPAEVTLLPGVREALTEAVDRGIMLFLFTNQSGVGRGLFTLDDVHAVNRRMIDLLGLGVSPFAAICIAPETPSEPSAYRKPSPRFIHEMLVAHAIDKETAWMVGDSPVDWEAGLNAGIRTAAVVADPLAARHEERRVVLGVPAYATLLDWLRSCGRHMSQ